MSNFYVYVYYRRDGTPFYVGKGKGKRYLLHINEAIRYNKTQKHKEILAFLNDGELPTISKIVENVSEEFAFLVEEEFIEKYGRIDLGTGCLCNMTNGGDETKRRMVRGLLHYVLFERVIDDAYKEKVRIGLKRYYHYNTVSEETRQKLSEANSGEKNGMFGKHHTDEVKAHLSRVNIGKVLSEETRQKISKVLSVTMSGENNPFYGKIHKEESKQKIGKGSKLASDSYKAEHGTHWNTGRTITEETREKLTIERTCPHCGRTGRGSAMSRYHMNKCKHKESE
jgi:hypothetical protein